MMYALKGVSKISPVVTLYITHSMGTIIFLNDIYRHRTNYTRKIKEETGVRFWPFFLNVLWLSLFYNLCHIPKFYAMNYLSDISIVSLYGASVLFTYVFAVCILRSRVDGKGLISLMIGALGVFLLLFNDVTIRKHVLLFFWITFSSVFSGLYGVLFKLALKPGSSLSDKIESISRVGTKDNQCIKCGSNCVSSICSTKSVKDIVRKFDNPGGENKNKENIDFFAVRDSLRSTIESSDGHIVCKDERVVYDKETPRFSFLQMDISDEMHRKILFMKHYMSLTGLVTLLFYWPGLYYLHKYKIESIALPHRMRPLIHVCLANIISFCHNLVYFIIVSSRSPLFAQISGIILQPTFLFIQILKNNGYTCLTELIGCSLSFFSFLFLSDRH